MPSWRHLRTKSNTVADVDFRGIELGDVGAPEESELISFAQGSYRGPDFFVDQVFQIIWINDDGAPVVGAGAVTIEPVFFDSYPFPDAAESSHFSVGESRETRGWSPETVRVPCAGRWTVRLTEMNAPGGATGVQVWVLQ